jgi:hypothetical protein
LILDDWRKLHDKISNYLWKRKVKLNMEDQLSKKGTGKRPNCLIASPSSSHKHPKSVAQIQSKLQFQFDSQLWNSIFTNDVPTFIMTVLTF